MTQLRFAPDRIDAVPYRDWKDEFERVYLSTLMDSCGNVVATAADKSGIPSPTLYHMLRKHRLKR